VQDLEVAAVIGVGLYTSSIAKVVPMSKSVTKYSALTGGQFCGSMFSRLL
jgi:hypothetical protein